MRGSSGKKKEVPVSRLSITKVLLEDLKACDCSQFDEIFLDIKSESYLILKGKCWTLVCYYSPITQAEYCNSYDLDEVLDELRKIVFCP
jgi:hypothetical protein